MRAAVLVEPGQIEMQERPVPSPAPGDVLVRVTAVGVCGSDTHYYRHGRVGGFVVDGPLVLGHEAAGIVVAVGAGVDRARVGQRVSIEPQRPDPDSEETRRGDYDLCPHMRFFGTPPVDGAFCDYVAIGAVVTQVARAHGATEIIVSDPDQTRRDQALRSGATATVDPTAADPGDLADLRVDAFVDASGAPKAVDAGIRAVRPAGAMVTGRFPLEIAAEALDSDRLPGTVKTVVTVS